MNNLILLALAVSAVVAWALCRHLYREPTPEQQRERLVVDTQLKLLSAECELDRWSAEVPMLRARLSRLQATKPADTLATVGRDYVIDFSSRERA